MTNTNEKLQLRRGPEGLIEPSLRNIFLFLAIHPEWKGIISANWGEHRIRVIKKKEPPFPNAFIGPWTYQDTLLTVIWLQSCGEFSRQDKITSDVVYQAINAVAMFNESEESLEEGFLF